MNRKIFKIKYDKINILFSSKKIENQILEGVCSIEGRLYYFKLHENNNEVSKYYIYDIKDNQMTYELKKHSLFNKYVGNCNDFISGKPIKYSKIKMRNREDINYYQTFLLNTCKELKLKNSQKIGFFYLD
jgi:hypothetical protein